MVISIEQENWKNNENNENNENTMDHILDFKIHKLMQKKTLGKNIHVLAAVNDDHILKFKSTCISLKIWRFFGIWTCIWSNYKFPIWMKKLNFIVKNLYY